MENSNLERIDKMKCKVCGTEWQPSVQARYIAVVNGITGRIEYDCFDCPKCGCQNIAGNRIPTKKEVRRVEAVREYVCDHLCVHAAEDSEYLEQRCEECKLEELTRI